MKWGVGSRQPYSSSTYQNSEQLESVDEGTAAALHL